MFFVNMVLFNLIKSGFVLKSILFCSVAEVRFLKSILFCSVAKLRLYAKKITLEDEGSTSWLIEISSPFLQRLRNETLYFVTTGEKEI